MLKQMRCDSGIWPSEHVQTGTIVIWGMIVEYHKLSRSSSGSKPEPLLRIEFRCFRSLRRFITTALRGLCHLFQYRQVSAILGKTLSGRSFNISANCCGEFLRDATLAFTNGWSMHFVRKRTRSNVAKASRVKWKCETKCLTLLLL